MFIESGTTKPSLPGSVADPARASTAARHPQEPLARRADTNALRSRRHGAAAPRRTSARARLSADDVAGLVAAAARGSQRGWDGLVAEFGNLVWAVARAHRLTDADAADVAQATWLALLEHIHDLHDGTRVGAWLATTARRECLRLLRAGQRRVLLGDDAAEPAGEERPPDEELLRSERDRALWHAFAALRPSDQALLRLLMADPRPAYEEIAAALDIPIGSIGPTRARALARLRHALDSHGTLSLMRA